MADGTLDSNYLVLIDNWPGSPSPNLSVPTDGFAVPAAGVATAAYKVGTKIQVYNETLGIPGFSTFIYLQYEGTTAPALAARQVVTPDANTSLYIVTNDPDNCLSIAALPSAVALSVMTDAYFGWFWCGGVCPETAVTGLGGTYVTKNDLLAGYGFTVSKMAGDLIGIALYANYGATAVGGLMFGVTDTIDS